MSLTSVNRGESARSRSLRGRIATLAAGTLRCECLAKPRTLHLVLFSIPFFAVQAQGVEKTLFKLENDFAAAVIKRDARALEKLTAPTWVYSDESGVMERADGIKAFTSGTDTVRAASNENMRALLYGNSAVVIGILRMKGRGPTGPFDHRYRYTDAWVLMDGTWRCVASQDYLMPDKR